MTSTTPDGDAPPPEPPTSGPSADTPESLQPAGLATWWPGMGLATLCLTVLIPHAAADILFIMLLVICWLGVALAAVPGLGRVVPGVALLAAFIAHVATERFDDAPGEALAVCVAIAGASAASAMLAGRSRQNSRAVGELEGRLLATRMRERVEAVLDSGGRNSLLSRELSRARRFGRSLSLVRVSIDNLDIHRERLGDDAALVARMRLAETFGITARVVDGAEVREDGLLIVLPETDVRGARIVAERIRLGYSALGLLGGDDVPITVSIGVANHPLDGERTEDLLSGTAVAQRRAIDLGGDRTVLCQIEGGMPPGWAGVLPDMAPTHR